MDLFCIALFFIRNELSALLISSTVLIGKKLSISTTCDTRDSVRKTGGSSAGSVQFSSVQDGIYGIYALGKVHVRSTPSLSETVPMLVCLAMALSRPLKEDR